MSIIFGIRRPFGQRVEPAELLQFASATERYAPDGTRVHAFANLGMCFQAYCTHQRSQLDSQPASDPLGNVLLFDGRIDNYIELKDELAIGNSDASDPLIVLRAFERWGAECFARFTGDWALALWSATDQVLYLARDHAGTRTLYFHNEMGTLRWATHLDTFFAHREQYRLEEQFAACFLSGRPARELTPYQDISAVPPGHYLAFRDHAFTKHAHWKWGAGTQIRYRSDTEYEEHFLALFQQAVKRRTGPGAPILAELSGGMDSTSIVCMSDHIRQSQGASSSDLLDTISYYDSSEPGWNEKPYFSITETRRGKAGIHLQTSMLSRTFEPCNLSQGCYLLPGADSVTIEQERTLVKAIGERGYRVILAGNGGDEVLGGVPTPMPELADLLHSFQLLRFFRQAMEWSIYQRAPIAHNILGAFGFLRNLYRPQLSGGEFPSWIDERLRQIAMQIAQRSTLRRTPLSGRPSQLSSERVSFSTIEALPHRSPGVLTRFEYRYPYLDRDLLRFLTLIPREQLVRPGRRRSLMRRALATIVPAEILERRQKAYLSRTPPVALMNARSTLMNLFSDPIIARLGMIKQASFAQALDLVTSGRDVHEWPGVMRVVFFEIWLRSCAHQGLCPELASIAGLSQVPSCQAGSVSAGS